MTRKCSSDGELWSLLPINAVSCAEYYLSVYNVQKYVSPSVLIWMRILKGRVNGLSHTELSSEVYPSGHIGRRASPTGFAEGRGQKLHAFDRGDRVTYVERKLVRRYGIWWNICTKHYRTIFVRWSPCFQPTTHVKAYPSLPETWGRWRTLLERCLFRPTSDWHLKQRQQSFVETKNVEQKTFSKLIIWLQQPLYPAIKKVIKKGDIHNSNFCPNRANYSTWPSDWSHIL